MGVVLKNRSVISSEKIISNIFSAFQKRFFSGRYIFFGSKKFGESIQNLFFCFQTKSPDFEPLLF